MLEAKTRATTVGIVDWNTIAPVMLPIASVSLPWRTQMTELNFSGSSVAIGAMTSASRTLSTPSWRARWSTASTKKTAPSTISAERREDLQVHDPQPRDDRIVRVRAAVEAMEAQRREVGRVDVRVGLEMALHVPGVDADQHDGDDPLEPDRLERQERGADGDPVGDREVAHVVGQDARVDAHRVAGRAPARRVQDGDAGHEHGQRREHERRAEDRADADLVATIRRSRTGSR